MDCKEPTIATVTTVAVSTATLIKPRFHLPLFVLNESFFYTGAGLDPLQFNAWSRKNGWHRPINVLLPLCGVCYIVASTIYFAIMSRVLPPAVTYIVGLLSILQLSFTLITISADTEDRAVAEAKMDRNVGYEKLTGIPVIDEHDRFCNICQVKVGLRTKHCKFCNKCVGGYDHHCVFLSTCVAESNYRYFLGSVGLAAMLSVYFGVSGLYAFALFFTDRHTFDSQRTES